MEYDHTKHNKKAKNTMNTLTVPPFKKIIFPFNHCNEKKKEKKKKG